MPSASKKEHPLHAGVLFRLYVSEQKWIGMTVFPTEQAEDAFSRRKIAAVSY